MIIGEIDARPICVSISYVRLNGKLVAFYDGTSQLVDLKMIDEWIELHAKDIPSANASNFHQCFDYIGAQAAK